MDAGLLRAEIDRMYVLWGLEGGVGTAGGRSEATPETAGRARAGGAVPRGAGGGAARDGADGRRTKKLLVAFHFQFSNQAGWECDACRKSGLEQKRRCGWLGLEDDERGPVVWARTGLALTRCPKSSITAESEALVEEFFVRRRLGGMAFAELSARQVEAFVILESALVEEKQRWRATHKRRCMTFSRAVPVPGGGVGGGLAGVSGDGGKQQRGRARNQAARAAEARRETIVKEF